MRVLMYCELRTYAMKWLPVSLKVWLNDSDATIVQDVFQHSAFFEARGIGIRSVQVAHDIGDAHTFTFS
ncbi:Uncharacterised protein [Klebsiella pneumoniae]|uniref:Uncharacterized protein n=1 Tax=Klebsiella pneumoniae TaxID=573 RepID=A0A2X3C4M4_KLEPN|nr:Uncharacterised protein [Klebsiella pneumoniae]